MGDLLTTIVSTVVVLGIMILVHEWGHFVAARAFGVRVDIFSIGFGPRLWGRKSGDTDYRISALPLGGYVKMAGDNPSEERAGDPAEFLSKPRWQRAIIALAGPTMNIVMALAILATLFAMVGEGVPSYFDKPAEIAAVPKKSSAEHLGIQAGDRIVAIDGKPVRSPDHWSMQSPGAPGVPMFIGIDNSNDFDGRGGITGEFGCDTRINR